MRLTPFQKTLPDVYPFSPSLGGTEIVKNQSTIRDCPLYVPLQRKALHKTVKSHIYSWNARPLEIKSCWKPLKYLWSQGCSTSCPNIKSSLSEDSQKRDDVHKDFCVIRMLKQCELAENKSLSCTDVLKSSTNASACRPHVTLQTNCLKRKALYMCQIACSERAHHVTGF